MDIKELVKENMDILRKDCDMSREMETINNLFDDDKDKVAATGIYMYILAASDTPSSKAAALCMVTQILFSANERVTALEKTIDSLKFALNESKKDNE